MERRGKVVMIAVDLATHRVEPLLEALDQVGGDPRSEIHLLSVFDRTKLRDPIATNPLAQEEDFLATTPALLLERLRTACVSHGRPEPRAKAFAHARLGTVVETILQACVDHDVDLLICGTDGRTGLARLMQGSVAESLTRAAKCPVLVARRKSYRGLARTPLPDPPLGAGERPPEVLAARTESSIASTTLESWEPSDGGPTGFRIV